MESCNCLGDEKLSDVTGEPLDLDVEELQDRLFHSLVERMEQHKGLAIFAKNRSKFEGWLKVEVIDILKRIGYGNVLPEKNRIDVTFDDCAMELKTCNTSYRYEGIRETTSTITNNVDEIINDLQALDSTDYSLKISLFVVFPLQHNNPKWKRHIDKIDPYTRSVRHKEFQFGNVPAVIYSCIV